MGEALADVCGAFERGLRTEPDAARAVDLLGRGGGEVLVIDAARRGDAWASPDGDD